MHNVTLTPYLYTGEKKEDSAAKVTSARTLWVPAVNNHGGPDRWTFIEMTDPWNAQEAIRDLVLTRFTADRIQQP